MRLITPGFKIEDEINGEEMLMRIEKAGRTCYKSENKITKDSAKEFIKMLIKRGHETVIEHEKVTVRIVCDRGVTHEIVRHRLCSYSQESTRYCNYSGGVTFIIPCWVHNIIDGLKIKGRELDDGVKIFDLPRVELTLNENRWVIAMIEAEINYKSLLKNGWTLQQARSVLPNSLKTEIVMTCNLREWRHFFKLRTSSKAHPQMQEIVRPMLDRFKELIPIIFDDINYKEV